MILLFLDVVVRTRAARMARNAKIVGTCPII